MSEDKAPFDAVVQMLAAKESQEKRSKPTNHLWARVPSRPLCFSMLYYTSFSMVAGVSGLGRSRTRHEGTRYLKSCSLVIRRKVIRIESGRGGYHSVSARTCDPNSSTLVTGRSCRTQAKTRFKIHLVATGMTGHSTAGVVHSLRHILHSASDPFPHLQKIQ